MLAAGRMKYDLVDLVAGPLGGRPPRSMIAGQLVVGRRRPRSGAAQVVLVEGEQAVRSWPSAVSRTRSQVAQKAG